MVAAALARSMPERPVVIVAPGPAEAERWLADLRHLTDLPLAYYPQRESLGEDEPHLEIAGERVETLDDLLSGRLRLLVTTARATAERTSVPLALGEARLVLHAPEDGKGMAAGPSLSEVADLLENMGYLRVPQVTQVAEYSVRGGIVDIYGFGMAQPARAEWWGDDLIGLRVFDLTTQRSGASLPDVVVLPVRGHRPEPRGKGSSKVNAARQSLLELLPPDTLILQEKEPSDAEEVARAWQEAEHHLEVARRMGEGVPGRDAILESPESWQARLGKFARLTLRDDPALRPAA